MLHYGEKVCESNATSEANGEDERCANPVHAWRGNAISSRGLTDTLKYLKKTSDLTITSQFRAVWQVGLSNCMDE